MGRILLVLAVVIGLSPGLVWRSLPPPPNRDQVLKALPLPIPDTRRFARIGGENGPVVTGLWQLASPNDDFGSYSALTVLGHRQLLSTSDTGRYLRFAVPGDAGAEVEFGSVFDDRNRFKAARDIESAARDPETGRIWLGLEGRNAIVRTDARFDNALEVRPEAMRHWPRNSGPEAMTRLADGRFLVLSEGLVADGGRASQGLLFPADPVEGGGPVSFSFDPPAGFNPSDIAILPSGKALILVRGVGLLPYPHFTARLLLADPATIGSGTAWEWQPFARLEGPVPRENYEGLAITGGRDGEAVTIWLISDDNGAVLLQRSLLVRLEWHPAADPAAADTQKKRRRNNAPRPLESSESLAAQTAG